VSHFIRRMMEEINARVPNEETRIHKMKEYWCLFWKSLPISEMQARAVLREEKLTIVEKMICDLLQ
jgi:hypothetical protein